jgi:predicted secreted hydrolase
MMRRRPLLIASLLASLSAHTRALPARALAFPRDHGSHPELRTEWWYLTGHASVNDKIYGYQITFFRSRVPDAQGTQSLRSAFAAKQLIFAHAAITDVSAKKHWHDQRIAREGFDLARAREETTDVKLRDWTLLRNADGSYQSQIKAKDFTLDLTFTPTQPLLLQGASGLSRKGPDPKQASYYYSQPHLATRGTLSLGAQRIDITQGTSWLDHEWSDELLHPEAQGWDWIGINLDGGRALTAFELRRKDASALWAGGSLRAASASADALRVAQPSDIDFKPIRNWKSPSTGASYPVEWRVRAFDETFTIRALLDAQELDSRNSTGAIYWEGLSDAFNQRGLRIGRGYLEMTGYAGALRL